MVTIPKNSDGTLPVDMNRTGAALRLVRYGLSYPGRRFGDLLYQLWFSVAESRNGCFSPAGNRP